MPSIILYYNQGKTHKISTKDKDAFLSRKGIFAINLKPLINCALLETLYLRENRLTSVNLSPLSQCQYLKNLHLDRNSLTSLDLTPLKNCQRLEKVTLNRNPLNKLDISPLFSSRRLETLKVPDETILYARNSLRSNLNEGISDVVGRIQWYEGESVNRKRTSNAQIDERTMKKALGVLKSFPRISMSDLGSYSGLSPDRAREMVFELVGDGLLEGRFNAEKDEFVCVDAVVAEKKMKSKGSALARCAYCGKPLPRALTAGEELTCPSCGMINIG